MLVIIPATTTLVDVAVAQLGLQAGADEAVRLGLGDDRLVALGRDERVDLDAVGAGLHEGRVRRVPDVLDVDDGRACRPERVEHLPGGLGRGLRLDQRVGPAGKVVALDVDDHKASGHGLRLDGRWWAWPQRI